MLDFRFGVDDKKTKIRGDEFVAAAAGVEFPTERAEFFDEGFLDEMVDVFGVGAERIDPRGVRSRMLGNPIQRRERLLHLCGGENADGLKRFGPGAVDSNLVR